MVWFGRTPLASLAGSNKLLLRNSAFKLKLGIMDRLKNNHMIIMMILSWLYWTLHVDDAEN